MESISHLPYIKNSSLNDTNSQNEIVQTSLCKNKILLKRIKPINFTKRVFHNLSTISLNKNLSHYRKKFFKEINDDIKDKEINNKYFGR